MQARRLLVLIVSLVLALTVEGALAAPSERRVAFVVGNAAYQRFPSLPNPRNDAEDVTSALKKAGFQVYGGTDLTREALRDQLRQFARAAQGADAALAYYAGHGLQYKGRNYIVPVDAKLQDEFDLEYETVRVDDIVGELNRADAGGARILILDACRNLPLKERSDRNPFDTGLAKISGRGLVVAYATQANALAYDGAGRNSIFTSAFLKVMDEPGLDLPQFFQRVSIAVDLQSGGQQTPELSLSYPGKFVFNRSETDRDVWRRIRDSNDAVVLRDFVKRYPESDFTEVAKLRLKRYDDWNSLEEQLERRKKDAEVRRNAEQAAREAESKRRADEARQRKEVEEQAAAEKRLAEAARLAEEARLAEDAHQRRLAEEKAEEARQRALAEQQAAEAKRAAIAAREAEQERAAAEALQRKMAEEQAENARRATEAARLAEEARQRALAEQQAAEAKRAAIAAREAEQERAAAEARQRKMAEEQAENARRATEAARLAEEARQRALAKQQAAEAKRAAIAAREAEQERAAAEANQRARAEEARVAQEARRTEPHALAEASKTQETVGLTGQNAADAAVGETGNFKAAVVADHPVERVASLDVPTRNADASPGHPLGEARFAYNALQTPVPTTKPGADGAFPGETITRDRLVRETEAELGRIGCIDEMPDQVWNSASRDALARYARQAKLRPVPVEPTPEILKDLLGRPAHFCPLLCGPGQHANGNQCVASEKPKPKPPAPEPKPVARQRKPEPKPVVQNPKPTHEVSRPKPKPVHEAVRPRPAPAAMPRPTPAPPQAPVSTASRPMARPMMGVGF